MKLIGMLDSPYVRRVAISLDCLGVPFEHDQLSVFTTFAQFREINPVVKAPTLVCDDGEVLMDSSLILQYVEATQSRGATLWSRDAGTFQHQMRAVALALAACEKGAQIVYERSLRPAEAQFEPWLERVRQQLLAACAGLEQQVQRYAALFDEPHSQCTITTAVAWQFIQSMLAHVVPAAGHPSLVALSGRMERTPLFRRHPPDGPGVPADGVTR